MNVFFVFAALALAGGAAVLPIAGASAERTAPARAKFWSFVWMNAVMLGLSAAPAPVFDSAAGMLAAAGMWEAVRCAWIKRQNGTVRPAVFAAASGLVLLLLPCLAAGLAAVHGAAPHGAAVAFLIVCVAANDAFAQIGGHLIGRTPLARRLSPKKTWEGAACGFAAAVVCGAILGNTLPAGTATRGASLGAILAVAGTVGDLVFSSWKRAVGVKDFSSLLGPHGGILDRFDSLLFAALVAAWVLR